MWEKYLGLGSIQNISLLSIFSIALVSLILVTSQSPAAFAGMGGFEDKDGDGFSTFQGDCNDNDPDIVPGSDECDPAEFINYVTDETEDLADDGYLTSSQVDGLIDALQRAVDRLATENYESAAGALTSFMNKISSYINNGTIPEDVGQPLIDQVQMLVDMIK